MNSVDPKDILMTYQVSAHLPILVKSNLRKTMDSYFCVTLYQFWLSYTFFLKHAQLSKLLPCSQLFVVSQLYFPAIR
jgi:hypothetical protein